MKNILVNPIYIILFMACFIWLLLVSQKLMKFSVESSIPKYYSVPALVWIGIMLVLMPSSSLNEHNLTLIAYGSPVVLIVMSIELIRFAFVANKPFWLLRGYLFIPFLGGLLFVLYLLYLFGLPIVMNPNDEIILWIYGTSIWMVVGTLVGIALHFFKRWQFTGLK